MRRKTILGIIRGFYLAALCLTFHIIPDSARRLIRAGVKANGPARMNQAQRQPLSPQIYVQFPCILPFKGGSAHCNRNSHNFSRKK